MTGPLNPPPEAVVFDLDGVIVDSRAPVRLALSAALAQHGYAPCSEHDLDASIGPPTTQALAGLTGEPEDSASLTALAGTYHEHYRAVYLERTTVVAGIEPVLSAVGVPLALATSKPVEFVDPLLDALGLRHRFVVVCAPTLSTPQVTKSGLVQRALGALSAQTGVMVGDRSFDVAAAHEHGAAAIGVTWGIGNREELTAAGADLIVDEPRELLSLLEPGQL